MVHLPAIMSEAIKWNGIETPEEKEMLERIVWSAIEEIERSGYSIGEGKTANVCLLKGYPEICLKIISRKNISKNSAHTEMEFLDLASNHNLPVPKPVCSVETKEGKDYLFMETKGISLKDLVEKDLFGELPEEFDFKNFFTELRVAVGKMHEERIYHRDLHWGNVLIDKNGRPSIIDFGDAIVSQLLSENPYREINAKGELTLFQPDEDGVAQSYRHVGSYLKEKGFFEGNKRRENEI